MLCILTLWSTVRTVRLQYHCLDILNLATAISTWFDYAYNGILLTGHLALCIMDLLGS